MVTDIGRCLLIEVMPVEDTLFFSVLFSAYKTVGFS